MNKYLHNFIFLIVLVFASFFYIISSYYFRLGQQLNIKFGYILVISIIFGIISYIIKIPLYYYYGKEMSLILIHILFVTITVIILILYSYFILNEKIPLHTIIIISIIILLLILNDVLYIVHKKWCIILHLLR